MKRFPRLKYCGITRDIDVEGAIRAGASAIGLNFYPKSKRYIAARDAERLSRVASGRVERVGVFVNATPQQVSEVLQVCELDAIQLHGDEGAEWLEEAARWDALCRLPIYRALAYRGAQDASRVSEWAARGIDPNSPVSAILIDAHDPIHRGGTGQTARWDLLFPRPACFAGTDHFGDVPSQSAGDTVPLTGSVPMILAGGIHPDNVLEACAIAHPDGVDVASGIETSPGIKDLTAMLRLAERVQQYFRDLEAK